MRFPRNARIFRGQLDAAPIAGVFFLLVILLLLNSSFVSTPGVPIQLPELGELPGTPGASRLVALDLNGQLYYQHQAISAERFRTELQAAVQSSPTPLTLIVQADRAVRLDHWLRLSHLAREIGVREVLLATRPPAFPPASPSAATSP